MFRNRSKSPAKQVAKYKKYQTRQQHIYQEDSRETIVAEGFVTNEDINRFDNRFFNTALAFDVTTTLILFFAIALKGSAHDAWVNIMTGICLGALYFCVGGVGILLVGTGLVRLTSWVYRVRARKILRDMLPESLPGRKKLVSDMLVMTKALNEPELVDSYGSEINSMLHGALATGATWAAIEAAEASGGVVDEDIKKSIQVATTSASALSKILTGELTRIRDERANNEARRAILDARSNFKVPSTFDVEELRRVSETAKAIEQVRKDVRASFENSDEKSLTS
jgi:hypothetical protein